MKWIIIIAVLVGHATGNGMQRYRVVGKFMCGDKPLVNAQVMLYDEDTGALRHLFVFGTSAAGIWEVVQKLWGGEWGKRVGHIYQAQLTK
jgi:hypothetical protein